ncbi:MAG: 23S rRNA (adenine(2503)-C(2))-methyltransferase RlmN [Deltaproteobacteria bacterium]|nr:23S rRNA (adenine(2503)-C(2))-methyltransferase RlmN [Deltaproteobacteria bacterium]
MLKKTDNKNLKGFTLEELKAFVASVGEKPYRALQLYGWVFKKGARSIDDMTDVSKAFRADLKERGFYLGSANIVDTQSSSDGTIKFLLEFEDNLQVESVLIPEESRLTLCVSTQGGCVLGCAFCMTGKTGQGRDLALEEMIAEVTAAESLARAGAIEGHVSVTNIVIMGMGEPLLNFDNVTRFLSVLTDDKALGFGPRKVTLSTAGLVPMIKKLGTLTDVNLAVSLNATTDAVRDRIMPINKKYPLKALIAALREYPLKRRRTITIEYVLLKDINDSLDDARRLVKLLRGIPSKINLIPFNPFPGSEFLPPERSKIDAFQKILIDGGYFSIIRESRGADIDAACGQLSGKGS